MDWAAQLSAVVWRSVQDALSGVESSSPLLKAMIAGLLLIVTYFVAKLISRSIRTSLCKRVDETLGKFLSRLAFYTILISSSLGILGEAGLPVTGLVGVLTAAGFAIGLAFQGTLSNFAAGVLLLVFRPFKVGDLVVIANLTGRIDEIDLFTTTLDTTDNRRLVIPNSSITGGTIENVTYHPHRRVEVMVGIAYKCDLDTTRAALTKAVESVSELMIPGEGRGFQVMMTALSSSSVDWTVRIWTARENFFKTREQLTQAIKVQVEAAGLEIPFPQMQLHYSAAAEKKLAPEILGSGATMPMRPRLRRASDSEAA